MIEKNVEEENIENIVDIENLNVSYGNEKALSNLTLKIPEGVRCAIVGPNGSGKSTLLKSILGFKKKDSGKIKVMGNDFEKIKKRVAYVPQKASVNWNFPVTVLDVVLMGRYAHIPLTKKASKNDIEISINALKEMEMESFVDRQISELSGGQRQRVFIARALTQDVDIYMLDEPLTGVDIKTEEIIVKKFVELQAQGKTIISVHHNIYTLDEYFDYLVIMNKDVKKSGYIDNINKKEYIDLAFRG
ncbi:ABC transporter ATP-binding protein [Helcococcus kunzii]|uniref:metal ABC transporter ATP-binding protein n=1 Tax=Helcococcus kunzii TaxID=40091 RepID=UPI001C96B788|nr:ABC transporter ATP-binding protein [Helcococcus kunzii]QZO76774.1 ABC transporter ATP-binding protein [Helcococcus kunzii]